MRTLLLLLLLFPGCCWLAKRDCYPACPPPQVVQIEKPCPMPPLVLGPFKRTECASQPVLSCFAPDQAAVLAGNLDAMTTWIKQVRARCGPPASSPATAPASTPAK